MHIATNLAMSATMAMKAIVSAGEIWLHVAFSVPGPAL
jgi:hypothetical protein